MVPLNQNYENKIINGERKISIQNIESIGYEEMILDLDILNHIQQKITDIKNDIKQNNTSEEMELAKKLDAIKEYTVDRFEGDYAILEDRKTNEIKNVKKDMLPENIKEGSILQYVNEKYVLDEERTKEEMNRIKDRMKNLWN